MVDLFPDAPHASLPPLSHVIGETWQRLAAARNPADPWRTPVLGTMTSGRAERTGCRLRTIVLRNVIVEQRLLICHTDRRSPKLAALAEHPVVSWLFYDPQSRLQVEASGEAVVHLSGPLWESEWQAAPLPSRLSYLAAHAPGTPIAMPVPAPSGPEADGQAQFAVIACEIERLDWLQLDSLGHRRAEFEWDGHQWCGTWVMP